MRIVRATLVWAALWLASPALAAPQVSVAPDHVVLGVDKEVRVLLSGLEPGLRVLTAASAGALRPGDSEFEYLWTPPDIRYPSAALLIFWQPDGEDGAKASVVAQVPLYGRTVVEMDTEPGAEVRVTVGAQTFGPERANGRGRVKVPILVPPGVRTAEAVAAANGRVTKRTVPLETPPISPVAALIGPAPLFVEDGGWLLVAHGEDVEAARVRVSVDGGSASLERDEGGLGVWRVRVAPGKDVTAEVSAAGAQPVRVSAPVAQGKAPAVPAARTGAWTLQAFVGGYVGTGANSGPALQLGGAWRTPLFGGRLALEAEAGFRRQTFDAADAQLGRMSSAVTLFPVTLGARARVFVAGPFAVDVRAGGGAVPFLHAATFGFQDHVNEGGVGWLAYGAAEALWRMAPVELLAQVRGDYATVQTSRLSAKPGGFVAGVGARWSLP